MVCAVSDAYRRLTLPAVPRRLTAGFILPRAERPLQSAFSQSLASAPRRASRSLLDVTESASRGLRRPSSRHRLAVSTCRAEIPAPRYVPSSAFLPPSTVCSTTRLVGLFHPTTTSRVFPSGVWPHCESVPSHPGPMPSCRFCHHACPSEDDSSDGDPQLQGFAPRSECDASSRSG
jgi:hypothetical protein